MWANPSDAEIRRLLGESRHITVVGLSPKTWRDSHSVALYLQRQGYVITGVHPIHATQLGEPCYPSIASIPSERPIDIVNIFRRASEIGPPIDEAIARGVRAVWIQSGIINEPAAERARAAGLLVVMDRCIRVEHASLL